MENPLTKEKLKSEETKKKMSESQKGKSKGKPKSKETKDKIGKANSIKVVQLDKDTNELIKIWNSAMEAQRECGFANNDINKCCRGVIKTAGGYHWRYATQEEIESLHKTHTA